MTIKELKELKDKTYRYFTEKDSLAAIEEHGGWALQEVKKQTPRLCMAAVTQDGWALQYVKDKTLEICMAAVESNPDAIYFVPYDIFSDYTEEFLLFHFPYIHLIINLLLWTIYFLNFK